MEILTPKNTQILPLEKILNIKMDQEDAWTQSTLPVARGGLGIRSIKDIALPAFISSAYGTTGATKRLLPEYITEPDYQELVEAEEEWWTRVGSNDDLQILNKAMQSEWDKPLAESIYQGLLEKQTAPVEKARLIAVASEHSSDWMNALPIKGSELKLDDTSLRIAVGLRLGLQIVTPHKCNGCNQLVDPWGRHGLSCLKNVKGTHARHKKVNDMIQVAISVSGTPAETEPRDLDKEDGKQPDGWTLYPWTIGLLLMWDYTCRDTLAASNVLGCSKEAGSAAMAAEDIKRKKYSELAKENHFIPIAQETFGSWGPSGLELLKEIGTRTIIASGNKRARANLFQNISMAMIRGNIINVKSTLPPLNKNQEFLFLN